MLALPGDEYLAWERHIARHPPTTRRVEMLLATLLSMFANVHKKEHAKPTSPKDFAPWLFKGKGRRH